MKLPMLKSFFYHEANRNGLLTLENYTSLGILAFQAASFLWLKKNNNLFGTELISEKIDISGSPFSILPKNVLTSSAFSGWLFFILCSVVNTLPQDPVFTMLGVTTHDQCIHSNTNTVINTLLLASSMMHMSNLIYNDALTLLKKNCKKFRTDAKCLVCWKDEPAQVTLGLWWKQLGIRELFVYLVSMYTLNVLLHPICFKYV